MLNEIINNKLKEVNQLRETLDISDININTSQKNHFYKKLFNNQNNKHHHKYNFLIKSHKVKLERAVKNKQQTLTKKG